MSYPRALLVDDLAPCRAWLRRALEAAFPGIAIDEAGSLAQARACMDPAPPLALVDLGLPDGSGTTLIAELAPQGCLCIVTTVFNDDAHLFPALRAGAGGYVLKDQTPQELAAMLRSIADGHPPLSPTIARRLLQHFRPATTPMPGPASTAAPSPALGARETEVLQLIAKGYTVQEVADSLGLSRHTVAGYLKDIYRKLSVNSRAEATLEAARRGLIAP